MTSGWFITLEAMAKTYPLPVKLFSIDRCFRRRATGRSNHLMTYHSASCVWMDDEVSLDLGMAVSESLLEYFGFKSSNSYQMRKNPNITSLEPRLKFMVIIPN